MILPVILSGGSGTRLWPLSRQSYPKQFLALQSSATLFQQTIKRLENLNSLSPLIVCNEEHRFIVAEQLRQENVSSTIILEPEGKNTAPALALAAFKACEDNDPVLLVLPADHDIKNIEALHLTVKEGEKLANRNHLVTFGVPVTKAETEYGYIKTNDTKDICSDGYIVEKFVEKPNYDTAKEYLKENEVKGIDQVGSRANEWLWNSGIFMCKASRYLEELKNFHIDIYQSCYQAMIKQEVDSDFIRIDAQAFKKCPVESIDYAVLEPVSNKYVNSDSTRLMVVPFNVGWNDIGGYFALWQASEKDDNGNVLQGDIETLDSENSLVIAGSKLVTTLGIKDLIVVDTKDALLVAEKASLNKLKEMIGHLRMADRSELSTRTEVFRPWGKFDLIGCDSQFKVKRLIVKPGSRLSLQSHKKRNEYWVVVSGNAKVRNGLDELYLQKNESTFIPANVKHSLENIGDDNLEVIEVQSGEYLGEDDIIRYEDKYGRCGNVD